MEQTANETRLVTVTYRLSETGQRAAILAGRPSRAAATTPTAGVSAAMSQSSSAWSFATMRMDWWSSFATREPPRWLLLARSAIKPLREPVAAGHDSGLAEGWEEKGNAQIHSNMPTMRGIIGASWMLL